MPPLDPASPAAEILVSPAGRWVIVGGLFALGAILGSFLNVVAHRWPRGMSVVRPPSHCPACGRPIRWHDNVPILGWIMLQGRCRDCGAAISPRYPIVEAICGIVSGLLAWSQCTSAAAGPAVAEQGDAFVFHAGAYGLGMLIVGTLLVAALLEYDGHVISWRMPAVVLVLVLAARWFLPEPGLAGAAPQLDGAGIRQNVVEGLLAAFVLAAVAWPGWVRSAQRSDVIAGASAVLLLCVLGAGLGPRGVSLIAAGAMLCWITARSVARAWRPAERLGWATWLSLATLIHMLLGHRISAAWPWLAQQSTLTVWLLCGVVVAVISAAAALARVRLRRATI
ncbi:MAG: prepilin peptidase [Pirellulales bacterium]